MPPSLLTSVLDRTIADAVTRDLQANACLEGFRQTSSMELAGVIDHLVQTYTRWITGEERHVVEYLFLIRDGLTATISTENEKGRSEVFPGLTEFFNLVTLDLLDRC